MKIVRHEHIKNGRKRYGGFEKHICYFSELYSAEMCNKIDAAIEEVNLALISHNFNPLPLQVYHNYNKTNH